MVLLLEGATAILEMLAFPVVLPDIFVQVPLLPLAVDFHKTLCPRYMVAGVTGSMTKGLTQAPLEPEGVILELNVEPFVERYSVP